MSDFNDASGYAILQNISSTEATGGDSLGNLNVYYNVRNDLHISRIVGIAEIDSSFLGRRYLMDDYCDSSRLAHDSRCRVGPQDIESLSPRRLTDRTFSADSSILVSRGENLRYR